MSYVQANTANSLGRRGLGWDNGPYPVYRQPRSMTQLNGAFNPAGADPSTSTNGAVTYRIDPRSGSYQFYNTDIRPRGVFLQNTFQHPRPPLMSALGAPLASGKSCLGCDCSGKCNRRGRGQILDHAFDRRRTNRRGLGNPNNPADPDFDPSTINWPVHNFSPPPQAGSSSDSFFGPTLDLFKSTQQLATASAQLVQAGYAPPQMSWWDQKTVIAGSPISNPVLAAGGVGLLFLLSMTGGRRR